MTSHTGLGQALSIIANRVSYAFGFHGPSIALDTACSSSLVAIHLACQSILAGESSLAVAGGVNVILAPETMVMLSKFGGLSPESRCKAFDADANGFARGEGGGIVVLKRLSDALADGDPIYCLIRGSAVNNDGASNGLSAPSSRAQEMVLRDACENAGIHPSEVQYVEAHGTGTALGDPIEAASLGSVFGAGRPLENPLLLGSVKTNIGHLEAASGIAGFIKVALSIHHGRVPASLHFNRPSPFIAFDDLRLRVQTSVTDWPVPDKAPLAGVSAFGWGGTNCHMILEGMESATSRAEVEKAKDACLTVRRAAVTEQRRHLVFVFSAQGSQWWGMGRDLLRTEPAFRLTFRECDRIFAGIAGFSLLDHLLREDWTASGDVSIIQPLLFAIQVSLAGLWRSWGVEPDAVVGHSLGEVAAAHVSGILSLEDAARVIHHYSRLQGRLARRGGMALIESPPEELTELLGDPTRLCIAGYNSPGKTVVSGVPSSIKEAVETLSARGVLCAPIQVNLAAHSPQVDDIADEMTQCLQGIEPRAPSISMISTLTGRELGAGEMRCDYWARNLRQPVLFSQATSILIDSGHDLFIEVSPHPIMLSAIRQTIAESGRPAAAMPSLRRMENPHATLYEALRAVYQSRRILEPAERPHIFAVSARTPEALQESTRNIARWLAQNPAATLEDASHTLTIRTSHHPRRFACVASTRDELQRQLGEGAAPGRTDSHTAPLAFVFCGQGSQWWGMGRELLGSEPIFADMLRKCSRMLEGYAGWSLLDELSRDESTSRLDETCFAQPAIFSIQASVAALWRSWGIEPGAVSGHSMGEIAAAFVAGALSLEDAIKVSYFRSRLLNENASTGRMVAVEMPLAEAESLVANHGKRLWIAAVNSQRSIVLSGEPDTVDAIAAELRSRDIVCRTLRVGYASHGHDVGHLEADLVAGLSIIQSQPPRIPVVSTVTGQLSKPGDFGAEYWGRNLRNCVRFAQAIDTLIGMGYTQFLEISPHPVLSMPISQCLEERGKAGSTLPSLRRGQPERATMLASLAQLYVSGRTVNWAAVNPGGKFIRLPGYPFQRQHYWFSADPTAPVKGAPSYEVVWREVKKVKGAGSPRTRGRWRIIMDTGGVGTELVRILEARGQSVVNNAESPGAKTVDLRALDVPRTVRPDEATAFAADLCAGVVPLLSKGATIWLVTRGAEPTDGTAINPLAACLGGFARGISLEHPDLWGGLIDLDPSQSPVDAAWTLASELLAPDDEDQVAIRGTKRYAPRIAALKSTGGPISIHADASYLVTGGVGSLGLSVARWLAGRGARQIVLTSRSGLAASNAGAIRELEDLGVRVMIRRADVSEGDQMRAVLDEIGATFPPLKGVVHAAGVLSRLPIERLDAQQISAVLRPKIAGALVLHEATAGMPLDFFVCFSSGASVWGSRNLAHYAAGNRFLDSFVAYRRSLGLPATCINWGAWEGDSMASDEDKAGWAAVGVHPMSRGEALETMGRLMAASVPQAVVARIDWSIFKPVYEARGRRLLLDEIQAAGKYGTQGPNGRMREKMATVPPADRLEFVQQYLRERVAHILGFHRPDSLDPDRGFFDMGMDSMMAVTLKRNIECDFDCVLPRTVAFEYPTVNALSNLLAKSVEGSHGVKAATASKLQAATVRTKAVRVAQASEADLEAMLARQLETWREKQT